MIFEILEGAYTPSSEYEFSTPIIEVDSGLWVK
jgi:hypothetical protein